MDERLDQVIFSKLQAPKHPTPSTTSSLHTSLLTSTPANPSPHPSSLDHTLNLHLITPIPDHHITPSLHQPIIPQPFNQAPTFPITPTPHQQSTHYISPSLITQHPINPTPHIPLPILFTPSPHYLSTHHPITSSPYASSPQHPDTSSTNILITPLPYRFINPSHYNL